MGQTLTPHDTSVRPSPGARSRRVEYFVAILVNSAFLYVAHNLLAWQWPGFLTSDFGLVLPWVTASCLAAMAANIVFLWRDSIGMKALGNVVTGCIGFVLAVRTLQVFPFDFTGYDHDWSWLARVFTILALVGSVLGVLVNSGKLMMSRLLDE